MDLLGPFDPPTDSGNRYVLVVGDTFSKWVEAYAIPNKEANTVAKHLTDFFCRFGIPQRLHSDRGLEFHNQVLDEIAKILQIQPSFTTAYRPQSNGMIERFNRTLIKMLKTFIDDFAHPTTWDTLLPMLTGAYRATEHSSTGCTPNLLFMGREVSIPLDLLAGNPPRQRTFYNHASYGQWLTRAMNTAHEYARKVLNKSATRQKRSYDTRNKIRKWSPSLGEWVYFYYPPYGRYKLGSPWIGPYVIVKKLPARTWLIQAGPDKPSRVVHEDNLKPVQGRLQQADNWIRQNLKENSTKPQPEDTYISPPDTDDDEVPDVTTEPPPLIKKCRRFPPQRQEEERTKELPKKPTVETPSTDRIEKSPSKSQPIEKSSQAKPTEPTPSTAQVPENELPRESPQVREQPPQIVQEKPQEPHLKQTRRSTDNQDPPDEPQSTNQPVEVSHEVPYGQPTDMSPDMSHDHPVDLPPDQPDKLPTDQQDVNRKSTPSTPEDHRIADEPFINGHPASPESSDSGPVLPESQDSAPGQKSSPKEDQPAKPELRRSARDRHSPKRFDPCEPTEVELKAKSKSSLRSIFDWFTHYFEPG